MLNEEKAIYLKVYNTQISYNAWYAAEGYFEIISPLCPKYPNIAHSLLRIAVRPLTCLGYWEQEEMYYAIETLMQVDTKFLSWLKEHIELIGVCSKELAITYILSDIRYAPLFNQVQLDFVRDEEIAVLIPYYDIITKDLNNINMEFSSYQEFRIFAAAFFERLNISQEEIDLILFEEKFEKEFESVSIK